MPGAGEPQRAGTDPAGHLRLAVEHASRRCDAILLTGDLAAHAGTDAEYDRLVDVLTAATVPVWLAAGNHDAPMRLRERFSLPGAGDRLDYIAGAIGGLRVVVIDTSREGRVDGALDASQCEWLAATIADGEPTLVALHHPCVPLVGEAPAMLRLDDDSIGRLTAVVRDSPIVALVTGHAHATVFTSLAGVPVVICPSSSHEFGFFEGDDMYLPGPPHYLEHSWGPGGTDFLTRVVTVDDAGRRPMR